MVAPRDYYADLELPPTAEIQDVKKQYRKLALKYHPDRNPGREAEVNSQFLIIQTAHDVLTDPAKKAKFDGERGRGVAGKASGVRGNPWADVGAQFPTPPRRNQPGRNTASAGADRWNTRFSSGVPPTARQQTSASSETRRNAARAFENMRAKPQAKTGAGGAKASAAPPPTPPRTESARQRQQASFGNRKSGYQPHASAFGDEPPVTNKNYSARRPVPPQPPPDPQAPEAPKHHQVNNGARVPDPLSQFRDTGDNRQSSPYVTKTGEKTNVFDASMGEAVRGQSEAPKAADAEPTATTANPTRKPSIFDLTGDDDTTKASAGKSFAKSSVDDINTSFVNDDGRTTWQFNAGGATPTESPTQARDQQDAGAAPPKPPRPNATEHTNQTHDGAFRADAWNDGFGSQTFAPPPRTNSAGSPSKTTRQNSRKTKTSKSAGGDTTQNAIFINSDDEEEDFTWTGRNGRAQATKPSERTDSPQAMDIDSPPASMPDVSQANGVRNIPVEPSRPEWRSGDFNNGKKDPEEIKKPVNLPVGGSEDTDEFQASFAEFKNVAPFANEGGGLKSFSSMRDELPFESKPSAQIPIERDNATSQTAPKPLVLPDPPRAPRPPPTIGVPNMKTNDSTWSKYVQEFQDYVRDWDLFTGQVTDHFAARKAQINKMRSSKGYGFLISGDGECSEYFTSVQQDNDVRRRWHAACEDHEQRLREFIACRDKMATEGI